MKYFLPILIATIIVSCSQKLAPDTGWGNQRWVVVQMKGVPVQQSGSRRDAFVSFNPTEKKFNGNAGCNQMSGNYSLDGRDIRFSEVITTKMACPDIEFETVFLGELAKVDRYEVEGTDLLLKRKREVLLVLRPRQANNP